LTEARTTSSLRRLQRPAALVAVVGTLAVAHRLGLLHAFAEPVRAARTVADLGAWGYLGFVLAYTVLQPFGVPGTVFIIAAPLIWPWPVAFALSMVGTMAASVVGFSFARFIARDRLAKMIPPRFQRYNEALSKRGFLTVFALRFVFWMPPPLHVFFGVSNVRFSTHFWGSMAGYVVPLFLVSFFGQKLFDVLKGAPPAFWVGVAGSVVVVALTLFRKSLNPESPREST
jgi:uncharacterized membrane protein YdjX (TVP38/TMEM64 family)